MAQQLEIPKRVFITRTAMCGGGLSYDVRVPVKHVPNYDGCRYTTICSDIGEFVAFEDATTPEEHFSMPLGWDRYEDKKAHNKRAEIIAFDLAKRFYPELEKLEKLPMLWVNGLLSPETDRDVLIDTEKMRIVSEWTWEDGKPVKVGGQ